MVVMWATMTDSLSIVEFWQEVSANEREREPEAKMQSKSTRGRCRTHDHWEHVYFHTVVIKGLQVGKRYRYRVGDPTMLNMSKEYWFDVRPSKYFDDASIVLVGDIENTVYSKLNFERLARDIDQFQLVIILGDLCYAKGSYDLWDEWGKMVEPVAAIRPMMVAPGNHEHEGYKGWSAYNYRFKMPENGKMNQYYSFAFGHAHITIISTEDPIEPGTSQHRWFHYDLGHATSHNKAQWFIVLGHRPPWSSSDKKWTHIKAPKLKERLEPMLVKYNVSLAMFAHIHAYERSTLVEGRTMYTNCGTGGSHIDDKWIHPIPETCRARISEFGYCILNIKTGKEMVLKFYSAERDEYFDEVTMTKETRDAPVRVREQIKSPLDLLPTPEGRRLDMLNTEDASTCKTARDPEREYSHG